jgi:rhodanese-related sulfurtransferase
VPKTVDELLAEARSRFRRVTAEQAFGEMKARQALLVDHRTLEQRMAHGDIAGAHRMSLTVLQWRLDPASPWKLPEVADHDARIVVLCQEGYSSSLAPASLHDLGLHRAADVIGGFDAWLAAGLPVEPYRPDPEPDPALDATQDP